MDLCRLYEGLYPLDLYLFRPKRALVSAAHASSAGNMMAVHQTPFNYSWYGHSKDFHLRSLRSTIIFCSVATIPLSGPYSCIFASFSLDAVGQRL
jgi:hypothetical protein